MRSEGRTRKEFKDQFLRRLERGTRDIFLGEGRVGLGSFIEEQHNQERKLKNL